MDTNLLTESSRLTPGVKDHSVLSQDDPEGFMIDKLTFDRPGKSTAELGPESLINHFDATKAYSLQHRLDRRAIGSAPISRVVVQLGAGVEGYHRTTGHRAIDVSIEDQLAFRNAEDPLQRQQRVAHVIEHP